jgi:hypothetical protein
VLQGWQQFSAAACAECRDRLEIRVSQQRIAFQGLLSEIPVVRFEKSNPDSVILRCAWAKAISASAVLVHFSPAMLPERSTRK